MIPVRTILHATDFSDCSDAAFRVACSLARDCAARLIVLNVAPRGSHRRPGELEDLLGRCQMSDPRVRVEHRLAEGDVTEQVLRVADESACDLIVMGTHSLNGLDRPVLGSVAESVLRGANCPVLVVKHPRPAPVEPPGQPAGSVASTPRSGNATIPQEQGTSRGGAEMSLTASSPIASTVHTLAEDLRSLWIEGE